MSIFNLNAFTLFVVYRFNFPRMELCVINLSHLEMHLKMLFPSGKKNYEVSFKTCNDRLLTATFWNCMTRCLQFSFVDKVRTNETRQLIINEMLASLVNSNWKVSWDRNARKGVELIVFFSVTVGRSVLFPTHQAPLLGWLLT